MITLSEWMKEIKYRITEGSDYTWDCYGPNAYILSYWDGNQDGVETSMVLDKTSDIIFECSVCDFSKNVAYRIINPKFKASFDGEVEQRNLDSDFSIEDEAWFGVPFCDVELEDFKDKLSAILNYQFYDERVAVSLDLNKDELFDLMSAAHLKDVTLNQFIKDVLKSQLKILDV